MPDPRDAAGLHPGRGVAEPAARVLHGRFRRHPPRAFLDAGLHRPGDDAERYRDIANRIQDSARLHDRRGPDGETNHELSTVDFYTSHEALLLEYEEALCRLDSTSGKWLAGSGHMIWIGDRTRQPDGAHVEFAAACRTRSA
jgi:3-deoxy-D-arabino-heptulosonate 7-phosphate (DAHP) synthase class II